MYSAGELEYSGRQPTPRPWRLESPSARRADRFGHGGKGLSRTTIGEWIVQLMEVQV
jgi:hypothetical protein